MGLNRSLAKKIYFIYFSKINSQSKTLSLYYLIRINKSKLIILILWPLIHSKLNIWNIYYNTMVYNNILLNLLIKTFILLITNSKILYLINSKNSERYSFQTFR